ncbi:MAG: hypothetical protein IIW86_05905, partial [Clostridia bacterium]|nr:hypothetical protein [Clostridia bacterium]
MEMKDPKFINGIVINGVFHEVVYSSHTGCETCSLYEQCHEFNYDRICHIFAGDGSFLDRGIGGYYVPKQTTAPANGIEELQDLIKKNKEMSDKLTVISTVFALYCLSSKETLSRQGKKLLYS